MSNGIEHRSPDSLIEAYKFLDKPNFMVLSGNEPRVTYEGGDIDEGYNKLQQYLDMIANSGTNAVYSLRVYDATQRNINNKTAYANSTRFNFAQQNSQVKDSQGNNIIVMPGGNQASRQLPNTYLAPEINERLKRIEDENKELRDKLQQKEIELIRESVNAQIAGLKQPEQDNFDRAMSVINTLAEKPQIIDSVGNLFAKLISSVKGGNTNYIQQPTAQVAGTNATAAAAAAPATQPQDPGTETQQNSMTVFVNPFIAEDEKGKTKEEKKQLTKQRIAVLTEDQMTDIQEGALQSIADRVGEQTLTQLLVTFAEMDDSSMNMVLNML